MKNIYKMKMENIMIMIMMMHKWWIFNDYMNYNNDQMENESDNEELEEDCNDNIQDGNIDILELINRFNELQKNNINLKKYMIIKINCIQ